MLAHCLHLPTERVQQSSNPRPECCAGVELQREILAEAVVEKTVVNLVEVSCRAVQNEPLRRAASNDTV